ncbi:hypothetical protein, partial [Allosphingosinicella sp.]|uniref:hypothetical protein n=1 Tax=Allosphingosinicella sp. TaxID=2823234 RepID=UPI002EF7327B
RTLLAAAAAVSLLSGCAGGGVGAGAFNRYTLVRPEPESVARNSMVVTPTIPWNKAPRNGSDISREENWTLNGPMLDGLIFIGGLQDNKRIVQQRRKADRKVPNFRADMAPPEIASMIETFYRVRAGSTRFEMTGLQPRNFLGQPGFQFDYVHLGGDEVERRGRAVGAVVNRRFYLALFDATRMHYFDAGLPEFERIVESARFRK